MWLHIEASNDEPHSEILVRRVPCALQGTQEVSKSLKNFVLSEMRRGIEKSSVAPIPTEEKALQQVGQLAKKGRVGY